MNISWKERIFACILTLVLLPTVISFVVAEQPSARLWFIIASSYSVGLLFGWYFAQRMGVRPATTQRPLSRLGAWLITLAWMTIFFGLQALGGKQLMGDVIAGFLSAVCGLTTILLGHYWRTHPR
jgi:hypothetical protein